MKMTKMWTVCTKTNDGNKYYKVLSASIVKVITYLCETYGVEPEDITYASSEEVEEA